MGGLKEIKGQKGETQTMVVTDDSGKKKEIMLFTLTLQLDANDALRAVHVVGQTLERCKIFYPPGRESWCIFKTD